MKTRNLLNMAVLTLAIASCGSKSDIESSLKNMIQQDAGKLLDNDIKNLENGVKIAEQEQKKLDEEIKAIDKKLETATGEEKTKLENEKKEKEAAKKKIEDEIKKNKDKFEELKKEQDIVKIIKDKKDARYKELTFVSEKSGGNNNGNGGNQGGQLKDIITIEKDAENKYTYKVSYGKDFAFKEEDFDLKNGNKTKVKTDTLIETKKDKDTGANEKVTYDIKGSMRKGGNEVRLSYSDFGAFEGIVKYLKIESNNPKHKAYEGREEKTGNFFAQGVKDLAATVTAGNKMTFKGKTFAFMLGRNGNNETEEFVDGTVKLDVDDTAKGKLNLNFGKKLDLTAKELDLSQTQFNALNGKVTATGEKVKGLNLGNANLTMNMYGPENNKPTEAVGIYRFDFINNGCQENCDGFSLNGSFGAKKE